MSAGAAGPSPGPAAGLPKTPSSPSEEAEALRAEIKRHAQLYYQMDRPELPDSDYDSLVARLAESGK